MKNSDINKLLLGLVIFLGVILIYFSITKKKDNTPIITNNITVVGNDVLEKELNNFTLKNGEEYKLINSALKQNFKISFNGTIEKFDSLIIGKGSGRYLSSNILLTKDSLICKKVTNIETRKAYKHNLKLQNSLIINIERKVDSSLVTIINEKDTLKINSDFVGMNSPFVHSLGSIINVEKFNFNSDEYNADVFVFGDSYVNCASPKRWPYYIYNGNYKFLCDGLPGGKSIDSYGFLTSALSIHNPKYVVWCLGMNDKSDELATDADWKFYTKKVMDLCERNNITLILATIPSVPSRNHTEKNKFIRESGYRFIDFDKAVSDGKGNWPKELLAKDEVHPTMVGAKTLAEQFLKDFPEIKNYQDK